MEAPGEPTTAFLAAVARFRAWADELPAAERQGGEWECNYAGWHDLYGTWSALVTAVPMRDWEREVVEAALYALARDNEDQRLARGVPSGALVWLAQRAREAGEADVRWQLAVELGERGEDVVPVLRALADDPDEYVRRRAIQSLARRASPEATALAQREWARCAPGEPWARMNALWVMHRLGDTALEEYLVRAEEDADELLRGYAAKVRRGEVERA